MSQRSIRHLSRSITGQGFLWWRPAPGWLVSSTALSCQCHRTGEAFIDYTPITLYRHLSSNWCLKSRAGHSVGLYIHLLFFIFCLFTKSNGKNEVGNVSIVKFFLAFLKIDEWILYFLSTVEQCTLKALSCSFLANVFVLLCHFLPWICRIETKQQHAT